MEEQKKEKGTNILYTTMGQILVLGAVCPLFQPLQKLEVDIELETEAQTV